MQIKIAITFIKKTIIIAITKTETFTLFRIIKNSTAVEATSEITTTKTVQAIILITAQRRKSLLCITYAGTAMILLRSKA
jgi:hypothetical protein